MGLWFQKALVCWWLLLVCGAAVFWPVMAIISIAEGNIAGSLWAGAIAAFVLLVPFRITMADKPWRWLTAKR